MSDPIPTELKLRTASRLLAVTFADGTRYELPFEYLRTHSPSAEVQGHGRGQETLVTGKQDVGITAVEPVGQYAVRLVFDDGHDSGLYTWRWLWNLGHNLETNLARYRERVARAAAAPVAGSTATDRKPGQPPCGGHGGRAGDR